jgi:hypothetical protein
MFVLSPIHITFANKDVFRHILVLDILLLRKVIWVM